MKRKIIVCAAAFAFAFSLVVAGGTTMAADKGPAEMTLKSGEGKKPAKFNHAKHQAKGKCGDCHHGKGADGKQVPYVEGQAIGKCESCHNASMTNPELKDMKGAAHKNCKGCHQKAGTEAAPTKCEGCHPKEGGK